MKTAMGEEEGGLKNRGVARRTGAEIEMSDKKTADEICRKGRKFRRLEASVVRRDTIRRQCRWERTRAGTREGQEQGQGKDKSREKGKSRSMQEGGYRGSPQQTRCTWLPVLRAKSLVGCDDNIVLHQLLWVCITVDAVVHCNFELARVCHLHDKNIQCFIHSFILQVFQH